MTVKVRDTDRYGRLVAEVILPDGRSLNYELGKAGMA
jgi:endonuclease YncB( thermonuclease family)